MTASLQTLIQPSTLLAAFFAGMVGVLVFHQGVWALFSMSGKTPSPPWSMARTKPFGLPQVLSASLWGGLWAIVMLAVFLTLRPGVGYWATFIGLGAVLTTVVALCVVFPLKGQPFAAGWKPSIWVFALALNGAWGFGTALVLRLLL